jgi:hypothetical protein
MHNASKQIIVKSLAEFAAAAANKVSIIFSGGWHVGKNSSQTGSVRFSRSLFPESEPSVVVRIRRGEASGMDEASRSRGAEEYAACFDERARAASLFQ